MGFSPETGRGKPGSVAVRAVRPLRSAAWTHRKLFALTPISLSSLILSFIFEPSVLLLALSKTSPSLYLSLPPWPKVASSPSSSPSSRSGTPSAAPAATAPPPAAAAPAATSPPSPTTAAPASPPAVSPSDLHPVYVGKSRRRYLVGPAVLRHPLFRELVERSSPGADCAPNDDDAAAVSVACEVVLFEHLLWMLENADPQPGSIDELVEFYAC
ncbi:hypothetical protein NL676_035969 [Syzygium grande]|nr:hypothetical protein NL676_035969 [Syzygium grande]